MMLQTLLDILAIAQADHGNIDVSISLPANLEPREIFMSEIGLIGRYDIGRLMPVEARVDVVGGLPETVTPRPMLLISANPE
jgi:hypothetical protein